MLRYAAEDDFGLPETAFNFCTFWLIEALHLVGRGGGGAGAVREDAGAADAGRPALGGHGLRNRRAVGQLSADLFACRTDQLRGAAVPPVERVSADEPADRHFQPGLGAQAAQRPRARRAGSRSRSRRRSGNRSGLWFGWSGEKTDALHRPDQLRPRRTASPPRRSTSRSRTSTNIITAMPTAPCGRSSTTGSTSPNIDRSFGSGYERVNERFAETVAPLIEPDDLVWVHDYHLIPLGQQLRQHGVKNRIGFFLHIPWPPHRLMVSLPYHQRLVRSMLAYDLIGFQTEEWLESFHHYVERELGGTVDADGTIRGRRPAGEDRRLPDRHRRRASSRTCSADRDAAQRLRDAAPQRRGQEGDHRRRPARLFQGAGRALHRLSPLPRGACRTGCGRVSLLQIAPPSRGEVHTYEHIREQLDELSGPDQRRVRPCRLGADPLRQPGLSARRRCRASTAPPTSALVTPLRDGMNLVAKEYRRRAGPGRSGRADPLPLRRRRPPAAARRCSSIPTARTRFPTRSARRSTCRGRSGSAAGRR